jgi:hypothetical protein
MCINEEIWAPKVFDTTNSGLQSIELNSPPAAELKLFLPKEED